MTKASFDFAKRAEEWARKRLSHFGARDDLPISSIEDIAEEACDAGARDYAEHVAEVMGAAVQLLTEFQVRTRHYNLLPNAHLFGADADLSTRKALSLLDSLASAEGDSLSQKKGSE